MPLQACFFELNGGTNNLSWSCHHQQLSILVLYLAEYLHAFKTARGQQIRYESGTLIRKEGKQNQKKICKLESTACCRPPSQPTVAIRRRMQLIFTLFRLQPSLGLGKLPFWGLLQVQRCPAWRFYWILASQLHHHDPPPSCKEKQIWNILTHLSTFLFFPASGSVY